MKEITPAIYIMSSQYRSALYTGFTTNLIQRIYQHKNKFAQGHTAKYNCIKLVYYEIHPTIESAKAREKQIKGGSRAKKLALINQMNPNWEDLYYCL